MNRKGFAAPAALLVGLMAITLAGPAVAQQRPTTGLGSAWPTDATDVSLAPGYHVYTWTNSGVKYIQVNDYAGNVLVAVATANGVFLPLPMGNAKNLQTPQDGTTSTTSTAGGVTVYQDSSVQVKATPQTSGTMLFQAAPCTNPIECTTHIASP